MPNAPIDWTRPIDLVDGTPVRIKTKADGGYYKVEGSDKIYLLREDGLPFTHQQTNQAYRARSLIVNELGQRYYWPYGDAVVRNRERLVATNIPLFARLKACEKANEEVGCDAFRPDDVNELHVLAAFARHIAETETGEVDPDLQIARQAHAKWQSEVGEVELVDGYMGGVYDRSISIQVAREAARLAREAAR